VLLQVDTWNVFDDEVARACAVDTLPVRIVEGHEMGVAELRQQAHLGLPPQLLVVVPVREDLDRHRPVQLHVETPIHDGHTAATDQLINASPLDVASRVSLCRRHPHNFFRFGARWSMAA
jgi:hypothetical protein